MMNGMPDDRSMFEGTTYQEHEIPLFVVASRVRLKAPEVNEAVTGKVRYIIENISHCQYRCAKAAT